MDEAGRWNAAICTTAGIGLGVVATAVATSVLTADSSAWLGFGGSIVGGGMTLVAGWAAWSAAQQQIAEGRRPEIERTKRADAFLRKYAEDWTDAIGIVCDAAAELHPERFTAAFVVSRSEARVPLDTIREACNVADLYIASDLIHKITDYIDPLVYIAFVDLNGAISDLRSRERSAFNMLMTDEGRWLSDEGHGSIELRDQIDLLKEAANECADRIKLLNKALVSPP